MEESVEDEEVELTESRRSLEECFSHFAEATHMLDRETVSVYRPWPICETIEPDWQGKSSQGFAL